MEREDCNTPQERALWILSHADQAEPREPLRGMALQLRLWHYRRSGLHVSWSIILPVREYRDRAAVVREATWNRSLRNSLVGIRDADFAWDDLEPFLEEVGGLRSNGAAAPAAKGDRSGIEGTRSFAHINVEWSGRGPLWFGRFRTRLMKALD
jgi:hypothetical protein